MDVKGRKILVYGGGKSGTGAAALLEKMGAVPFIYEDKMGDLPADIDTYSMVVMSPGVPGDIPNVLKLKEMGLPFIGEVELAYEAGDGTVLAITGTNGKTTTTSLLGEIMKAYAESVFVVGNIGTPYTSIADQCKSDTVVVAEISSFQLETIREFHPSVSAVLNITPDHLNRHHTMREYSDVKESIAFNQTKEDTCVLNYEDEELRRFGTRCPAKVVYFSSAQELNDGFFLRDHFIMKSENGETVPVLDTDKMSIIGVHNAENAMAAAAMADAYGVPMDTIARVIYSFKAVEHRIEYVGEKNGVVWYNDSKGTNPDAAIKGIQAMKWPTFLIGGGYDKGADYKPWIRAFDGKVKALLLEGKTRFDIEKAALECGYPGEQIVVLENMTEAMDYAAAHAVPGDAVLLSPACASWGEFDNYEVRGRVFKEYFEKL